MNKKAWILLLFCIILCLVGCKIQRGKDKDDNAEISQMGNNEEDAIEEVRVGDTIKAIKEEANNQILLENYSCIAWKNPEFYCIARVGFFGRTVDAFVLFSNEMELMKADGIEPIHEIDRKSWTGKTFADFVEQYGQYHFDFGSGLFIPSYVTETGLIYHLYVDNGQIDLITVFSLAGN